MLFSYSDVSKSGKQETLDGDMDVDETPTQPSASVKDATEESMSAMSPSYMSDASEAFAMSYQSMAQVKTYQWRGKNIFVRKSGE